MYESLKKAPLGRRDGSLHLAKAEREFGDSGRSTC